MIATYIALAIYMALTDWLTSGYLGYLYYPTPVMAIILILVAPLTVLAQRRSERPDILESK